MTISSAAGFLDWVQSGARVTRREAERMLGRDEVVRLIAEGKLVDNPMTERLEIARGTEDFYP